MHAIGRENGTLLSSVGNHTVRSTTAPKMVIRIMYSFTDPHYVANQLVKRPPKTPDRAYPSVKNQEYAHAYDWEHRAD